MRIGFLKQYVYLERNWFVGGRVPVICLKSWSLNRLEFRLFFFHWKRKFLESVVCRLVGHKFDPTTCLRCFVASPEERMHFQRAEDVANETTGLVAPRTTRSGP